MSSEPKPQLLNHTLSGQLLMALRGKARALGVFLFGLVLPALLQAYLHYRQTPFYPQLNLFLTIWYLLGGFCLWRCAFNAPHRLVGYAARTVAVPLVLWQLVCAYVILVGV